MKVNNLIKATPFLSTLIIIICLSVGNQKEYTKLRLLIWNSPSLSIGTYIAISTGTGFLLSYFITSNLSKAFKPYENNKLKFKEESKNKEGIEDKDISNNQFYNNTLIERDIKDPSPTINANFRIIGRSGRTKTNYINNDNDKYEKSYDFEGEYDEQPDEYETINQVTSISTDWNDESFSSW